MRLFLRVAAPGAAVLAAVLMLTGCSRDGGESAGDAAKVVIDEAQRARVHQLAENWTGEIDFTSAWSPSGFRASTGDRPQFDPNDPFFGLPRTEGYALVHAYCVACHETRLLMAQQQSRQQWQGVLDLMIKKHGMVAPPADQRRQIIDYLSRHFGR